jgi:sulfite reductase (NADPH) hemoprotein beta-component
MADKIALSEVEHVKQGSRLLRGTIAAGLVDPVTGGLSEADKTLIKFHGSYQQDDRDLREDRRQQKLEPAHQFMIRTRLPGGVCTPAQWLVLDGLARDYGNGSLRITTRQTLQLHGIIKGDLKKAIAGMNAALVDSIAACGDVNRNVIASANPVESSAQVQAHAWAVRLSEHLRPRTRAYYEIWLDEQPVAGTQETEPLYGAGYLPRKFKVAIAVPPVNDVDVFAHDLGLIAIFAGDALLGFNVLVGGGMGATHGDATTYPRLASVIGFITPDRLLKVAETVMVIQRDFGNRGNRKRARLKYTIDDRGLDWFRDELHKRLGYALSAARPYRFQHNGDRYGWIEGEDGRWHLTLHIESGRIDDHPGRLHLTGLREIARIHAGDFRLTPNQNLIVANVAAAARPRLNTLVEEHGLDGYRRISALRRHALACVALPTCGLAMAEAERYLPTFVDKLEQQLDRHGLLQAPILLRLSGCPNGCSRPYLAEIALVGKAPGRYNLLLGADFSGERLNRLYRESVTEAEILSALDPLLASYAAERMQHEHFGDFLLRSGVLGATTQSPAT